MNAKLQVHRHFARRAAGNQIAVQLDGIDHADEFAVAMALRAATDHNVYEDVERGKQRRGAASDVIVGLLGGMTFERGASVRPP